MNRRRASSNVWWEVMLLMHSGRAPLCTGCTMVYWRCTRTMHRVHCGGAPLCVVCTTVDWWCTRVSAQRIDGARCDDVL